MHYRKNVTLTDGDLPYEEARREEDELFTRLHFGGRLNEECIRLFAILDVPLALEILSQDVEPDDFRKPRQLQLLKLDKISQIAPGIDVPMKALLIFNMVKGEPNRVMDICRRIGPLPCLALITASGDAWSSIPVIGSFLDRIQNLGGSIRHSMSYDSYMDCQNLINRVERASEGLKIIAGMIKPEYPGDGDLLLHLLRLGEGGRLPSSLSQSDIEKLDDYEFVESIHTLLDSLRAVLLSTCTPGCLSMECNIDHRHDYPPINTAKRLLFAAVIRAAGANGVFQELRDLLAPFLLHQINLRA